MAFTTDAQVLSDVAGVLKLADAASLPAWWDGIVSRAHDWAERLITRTLAARGYSQTLSARWDEGPTFCRELALWRALVAGGATEAIPTQALALLDRRDELKAVQVTVAGAFAAPDTSVGQIVVGAPDTSDDVFVLGDGQDDFPGPGRGQPIRW